MSTVTGGHFPYSPDHFQKVLNEICIPAVKRIRFTAIPPSRTGTYPIDEEILARLKDADLVLCDISTLNPNVLFELGIRRGVYKPFAIIKDKATTDPFNLTNFNNCTYDPAVILQGKVEKEALIKRVAEHLRKTLGDKRKPNQIPKEMRTGAAACGISKVFPSRHEAEVEVHEAFKSATRRLWIIGIGLSQVFSLADHLNSIEERIRVARRRRKRFDARILLLDALTSTGVFRSLLESSAEKAEEIVSAFRQYGDERPDDPYFNEQLYHDFKNAWSRFRGRPYIDNTVRFYGHAPSCWLFIADDTAYFEPYTFGAPRNSRKTGGSAIGPLMPVFKFEGPTSRPFQILEDHFERLWSTTDTDLFHVLARDAEAADSVHKIFHARGHWLRQVHGILHKPGRERRQYPRKICNSKLENYVRRDNKQGTGQLPIKVEKVLNFSREGLAFRLNMALKKGDRIRVETLTPRRPKGAEKREKAGEYVKKMLVDPYDGRFRVVHVRRESDSRRVVGLQPIKKLGPKTRT